MDYIELKCPLAASEDLQEIRVAQLAEVGFESFVEEADHLLAYIPSDQFTVEVLHAVPTLKEALESKEVFWKTIADQNWNSVWESNYPPVNIDNRCYIRAPFHEASGFEYDILIKPKMAFGTAHHETTALMIRALLDMDVSGLQMLDMGCGTSVLAILAAKKGAASVHAIDNDQWAYNNSVENVALNELNQVDVRKGDADSLITIPTYHIILANINKNILLRDMEVYTKALKQGGQIFFSGFYDSDLEDITDHASTLQLNYQNHQTLNKWTCAKFVKQ